MDELSGFGSLEPNGLPAPDPLSRTSSFTYATDGTRRLVSSSKTGTGFGAVYSWSYDVFGNRLTENRNIQTETGCGALSTGTSTFAIDNSLTRTTGVCSKRNHYYTDRAGNRLAQGDSSESGGVNHGPQQIMSYTALNQLYFSMTPTATSGSFDYNWHLYDATGTRIETIVKNGQTYVPGTLPSDTTGTRTFYVYDGNDVALTVVKSSATWWIYQRYLTGGLDAQLGGRFAQQASATAQNLVLVGDYQGSTIAAIKTDGTQETNAKYWTRSPFGSLEAASGTGGSTNTGTGFTGASAPNGSGGFVYMRNRWYDPQTGRFLTQDPIGLAGGVNLYAYAGNNPISFSDPFGLECSIQNYTQCRLISLHGGGGVQQGVSVQLGPVRADAGVAAGVSHTLSLTVGGWTQQDKVSVSAAANVSVPSIGLSVGPSASCSASVTNGAVGGASCSTSGSAAAKVSGTSASGDKLSGSGSVLSNADVGAQVGVGNARVGMTVHLGEAVVGAVGAVRAGISALGRLLGEKKVSVPVDNNAGHP